CLSLLPVRYPPLLELLEPGLLLPPSEQPLRRPVQPRVRLLLVDPPGRDEQSFPLRGRQPGRTELAQRQQQRTPARHVLFLTTSSTEGGRVGTRRSQPVDQVASPTRIGAVLQQWPYPLGLPQPQQRHRRVGLPLRQVLLLLVGLLRLQRRLHHLVQ